MNFNILLTVHPNIIMVFFTNLMHKLFILIHLLHPSTCFKHYCAHPQEVVLYNYGVWQKVMRLATLCTNRKCCCLPLHMVVRLTPAVDSVQVLTCYSCYAIV